MSVLSLAFSFLWVTVSLVSHVARAETGFTYYYDVKPTVVAEFSSVEYDFSGSPWGSAQAAFAANAFISNNNIITGVNHYNGTTFVCVPRWKPGVPSTLNTLTMVGGKPALTAWPSWDWQKKFSYVQSVFVDQRKGEIWVIDAGRQNFFSGNPADVMNGPASLYIFDINTMVLRDNVTFSNDILPFTSSFLNDIVVDTVSQIAYMTDTNINGDGAIVIWSRISRVARRFYDPSSTTRKSGYLVNVNGKNYQEIQNPVDGIAMSGDGGTLYYASVDSDIIFAVPTKYLVPGVTDIVTAAYVKKLTSRSSGGDGLVWLPTSTQGSIGFGYFPSPALNVIGLDTATSTAEIAQTVYGDSTRMQWLDTFALVPKFNLGDVPTIPGFEMSGGSSAGGEYFAGVQGFTLYFTTNRLQLWFSGTMQFNQTNMRIMSVNYYGEETQDYERGKILLAVGWVLLIGIIAFYVLFFYRFSSGGRVRPSESQFYASGRS